jgi:hypothetical protein
MATKTTGPRSSAEIEAQLRAGFDSADAGLRRFATWSAGLHRARYVAAQREAARVAAKHGAQSDAGLAAADRAEKVRTRMVDASLLAGRAAVTAFEVPADVAILHGRVVVADGTPGKDLTVRIVSTSDKAERETTTDARGYFRLELAGHDTEYKVNVEGSHTATHHASATPTQSAPVRLTVLRGDKVIASDETAFQVHLGQALYRELTVED